jgi:hypothetical protein
MRGVHMAKSDGEIIGWAQFWAYFIRPDLDNQLRIDMAKDLRLEQFLGGISADAQIEVLEGAPSGVVRRVQKHLKLKAKIALKDILEPDVVRGTVSLDNVTADQAKEMVRRTFG